MKKVFLTAVVLLTLAADSQAGRLFHRRHASCGCGESCGCTASSNCGCQRAEAGCSSCGQRAEGGIYTGTTVVQGNAPTGLTAAVPDGNGGYKIVTVTKFYNGVPIVDGAASTVQQLPMPAK